VAMRPSLPSLTLSRRSKILLTIVAVLIVLVVVAVKSTGVYINWLWFGQVGFRDVYSTVLWTRIALFLIFGVLMALIIGGNLFAAYLLRPPFRPMSAEQQNLERYRVMAEPRRVLILVVAMIIAFFASGMSAQNQWSKWQLWLNSTPFGMKDPQFHTDISFYAFDYPVYRLMLGFGFTAIIFSVVLTVAVHYLTGAIRLQTPGPKITPAARRHLTVLVFVFMVLKALAYWLDRYGLVFSDRSKFTGASYTDIHSVLPARTILFWIAVVLALVVLASLWLKSALWGGIGFVVLMVLSILIAGIYPAIVQQVSVKPNASTKESPYIKRNIENTRSAYGIQTGVQVDYQDYAVAPKPDPAVLKESSPTLDNVRILDPNVISATFQKFQQNGNVYGFPPKLDVDRYTIGSVTHDYVVGVRELEQANLSGNQTNWINQHTNYTHGYGIVAAAAETDVTNDTDKYAAGGIPPEGEIKPTQPAVYYGELLPQYAIVGAKGAPQEFDANGGQKVRYEGSGGVSLGNFFTRLAFAISYKQTNFLLNDAASADGARIIFNRDPRAMVQKVAPYLKLDSDPYPFVDSATGHIVWMVDGYTTMNNYPYSQRQSLSSLTSDSLSAADKTASQPNDQFNYIRNSVKATVDAYSGKVTLYAWDESDPLLKAWSKVFPNTVEPKSAMPASVESHVRYPEDLFEIQRGLLGDYHVDDPVVFYNESNKWTVPIDPTAPVRANQPPYYILAAPPVGDSSEAQFQLTSPMNVNQQGYLAAYLSVDSDPLDYGKITVLRTRNASNAAVTQGPEQVYSNINNDPTITKDLSQISAGGNAKVIHGNLLTMPLGDSFVYVEPLYTQNTTNDSSGNYAQLQRVIVGFGNQKKFGYGETLADALSDFLPGHTTGQTLNLSGGTTTPDPGTSNPTPTPTPSGSGSSSGSPTTTPPPASEQALVSQMNTAYESLQSAYASGDAAKIGVAQQRVNELLAQYLSKYGTVSSSTPTSSAPPSSPSPAPS